MIFRYALIIMQHFFSASVPVSIRWRTALWIIFNFFYYPSGTNEEGSTDRRHRDCCGVGCCQQVFGVERFF